MRYYEALVSDQRGGQKGDIQQKGKVHNFGHEQGEASPVPALVANPDVTIKSTLRSVLGLITVMILKRVCERVFSFKATNLQNVRLEMKMRW